MIRTAKLIDLCFPSEINKFGIVEVDVHGKITSFLEKPLPSATTSRLAVCEVM